MLYLFFGADGLEARAAIEKLATKLEKKGPCDRFKLTTENFSAENVRELVSGQTMFAETHLVVLDDLLTWPEATDFLLGFLPELNHSPHHFVFLATVVPITFRHGFEAAGAKVEEFKLPATTSGSALIGNPFAVADALTSGDRKNLWVTVARVRRAGLPAEEIFWKLSWQLKAMRLALVSPSAEAAGLKPYPYQKSRAAALRFGEERLNRLGEGLVSLYAAARAGEEDFEFALERWVLSL